LYAEVQALEPTFRRLVVGTGTLLATLWYVCTIHCRHGQCKYRDVSKIKVNRFLLAGAPRPKEGRKFMRFLSKTFVVVVGVIAIGLMSSSVSAKTFLVGTFTLTHPTEWKNTMLPAGNYTFRLDRTDSDTNLLKVRGEKKTLDILIFAQSACETCRSGAMKVAVQGDDRVVTSLDLPGFHVDFNDRRPAAEREKQLAKAQASSEQVAVHVDSN
jgi:hypothetical protein